MISDKEPTAYWNADRYTIVFLTKLKSQLPSLICMALLSGMPAIGFAQQTVVSDSFESGSFAAEWTTTSGSGTQVVNNSGDGAGGSDHYARVQGVSDSGGLGLSLVDLESGSLFATDFELAVDFRVDNVPSGTRQFSFMVSAGTATPGTGATLNLRYQDGQWWAYDNSWRVLGDMGSVTPGEWNRLVVSGNNWGSGVSGAAMIGLTLTDHLGNVTSQSNIQIWQGGDPDANGARSVSLNDIWGGNPGFDVDNATVTAVPSDPGPETSVINPVNPVVFSGVYPHMAMSNSSSEAGVGGVVLRDNSLYMMTYPPHSPAGSSNDKMYRVDLTDLSQTTYLFYPGGTHANRYRDSGNDLDLIGAAYIGSDDEIRFLPLGNGPGLLAGRITGTSPHVSDPDKFYYFTMEEGVFEVDFSDIENPEITLRKEDRNFATNGSVNLPGQHGKGLYTAQNRVFVTNNGAQSGGAGLLAEWDGISDPRQASAWTIVDQDAQYTEVTSRHGPADVDPGTSDAVWALGWDDLSVIFNVREGSWAKLRLPKSSYTHGHPNGWYTEWPRVRDVGAWQGHLMSHHGMMFGVPASFSASSRNGLVPIFSHHKMIVDYVESGDQIVMSTNDATRFSNSLVPRANSNLLFAEKSQLANYGGSPRGYGGVAINQNLDRPSDPFFIGGFKHRVVHFEHEGGSPEDFTIEVDYGDGNWVGLHTETVPASGYSYYIFPTDLEVEWMRVLANGTTSGTAYAHLWNPNKPVSPALIEGIARPGEAANQGIMRSRSGSDYQLEFSLNNGGYHRGRLNPDSLNLEFVATDDSAAEAALASEAAISQDFGVDDASVFIDDNNTRFRLPKGDAVFDSGLRRGIREVVTERSVMNIHGTFYELPRNFTGGGIRRILPITTHNLEIHDFASWRGMLVLSGLKSNATGQQIFSSGSASLWLGNVDDLWSFGPPQGVGGPWKDTAVEEGQPSDPYLMAGYDQKRLEISHLSEDPVTFEIQVDFLGTGQWESYDSFVVEPGQNFVHKFEPGYSSHWIRLVSDTTTTATATFYYTVETSDVFVAESINVTRGVLASGTVSELAASDDADVSIRRNPADVQARVELVAELSIPTSSPNSMTCTLEASVFGRTRVNQQVAMFNFQSGDYEVVDTRTAQRFTDSVSVIEMTGDLTRFLEPGTNLMRARVRFDSVNPRQRFTANIDHLSLEVDW